MFGKRKRSSGDGGVLDAHNAMKKALAYNPPDDIFMTGKLNTFIKARAKKVGVTPTMVMPSVLATVANTMNHAKFELTEGWNVTCNLYILCVANKGAGKTSASKTFLDALAKLERKEKEDFDNNNVGPIDTDEGTEEDGEEEEELAVSHKSKRKVMGTKKPAKKKKTGVSDEGRDDADYVERQKFHSKQRIVDSITPEALFLTLFYGSGVLLIRSDEFKGFYDKFVIAAQNLSSFCSAYSGEPFNYTTVSRGAMNIDSNSLTILGSIQPGVLMEMINGVGVGEDYQGFWDRFIFSPGAIDYSVDLAEKLKKMTEEEKFDVDRFLNIINKQHQEPRMYTATAEAIETMKEIKNEFDGIDAASCYGNETSGMTSKGFTNTLKLAPVFACARGTMELMERNIPFNEERVLIDFEVTAQDMSASYEFVKMSQETYTSLKLSLAEEAEMKRETEKTENLLKWDDIDEKCMTDALPKIVKVYEKSKDGEILLSVIRRSKLYPSKAGWNDDVFVMALEKFGVAKKASVRSKNKVMADVLKLTINTDKEDVRRVFHMLWEGAKLLKPATVFDPLQLFENQDDS